jgi:hypothetical protein
LIALGGVWSEGSNDHASDVDHVRGNSDPRDQAVIDEYWLLHHDILRMLPTTTMGIVRHKQITTSYGASVAFNRRSNGVRYRSEME